jgi:ABC-type molybdate transport system substrate-binding protein
MCFVNTPNINTNTHRKIIIMTTMNNRKAKTIISISDPLTLPCGVTLPNRLAKAAMTEGLATP